MQKAEIAASWLECLLRPYAGQSASFFSGTHDPFRNPIGERFREALTTLAGELLGDMDRERVAGALQSIVEIRAVEDSTPSQALSFIFELKEVVGGEVDPSRIDEMALVAFDLYVQCRERMHNARVNEAKRRSYVVERAMSGGEV